ncbi:MAG: Crp/Fnr family transcriptional regulator [Proteobacteria bacterium]|nr:Crp/Fnr family transcriptional regulator [Burkholderiales bacterium]
MSEPADSGSPVVPSVSDPAGTSQAPDAPAATTDERAVVSALAAHGVVRRYPRNAVIITEGDSSDCLYVIVSGRVKVYLADEAGREVILNLHGPGEYIGEMSLAGGVRTASVMTLEPCELSAVSQQAFRRFIASDPDATFHLIRKLIERLKTASDSVRSLALLDVYGRVARLLLDLADEHDGELVVREPMTQQEIGNRAGCSREMVSRIFSDLSSGGYIRFEGRRIHLCRTLPKRW